MMVILGTGLTGKWSAFALTRGSCNPVGRTKIYLLVYTGTEQSQSTAVV